MKVLKRTWADISLDNLEHNYKTLREHVRKGPRFLGVVKADAYGHSRSGARSIWPFPISRRLCSCAAAA